MRKVRNLSIAIFCNLHGHYDSNDPVQDEGVVDLMDWLEGERLPDLYDPGRQRWIDRMAKEWLKKEAETNLTHTLAGKEQL